jgi:hypothetical protein
MLKCHTFFLAPELLKPGKGERMKHLETQYGPVAAIDPVERFEDGTLAACLPVAKTVLTTPAGSLVPQFSTDDARRKTVSLLSFHRNGMLRSIALEERTGIESPAGPVLAELATFHPNGALNRVFPLNGKLTAYWSQEDEAGLAEPLTLKTPIGRVTARVICLRFDPEGRLLGLTLFPGEAVEATTPLGPIRTRIGLSFYPNGALRSLEPDRPTPLSTPVGEVWAFDPDAVGVSGDENSLAFSPEGRLVRIATVQTAVTARFADGRSLEFRPALRESLCGDAEREPVPMVLEFDAERVHISGHAGSGQGGAARLALSGTQFQTTRFLPGGQRLLAPLRCAV